MSSSGTASEVLSFSCSKNRRNDRSGGWHTRRFPGVGGCGVPLLALRPGLELPADSRWELGGRHVALFLVAWLLHGGHILVVPTRDHFPHHHGHCLPPHH